MGLRGVDLWAVCVPMTGEVSSVSSRYSSTSTLCSSVVEVPVNIGSEDAPPPLPPRQRRRADSPHTPRSCSSVSDAFSPPQLPPADDSGSTPPVLPPRADLAPPPLPPRRPSHEPGIPPPGPAGLASRRHTGLPSRGSTSTVSSADSGVVDGGVVPQLPPRTYRQPHVRQSSS